MAEIGQARVYGPVSEEPDLEIPDQGTWSDDEFLRAFPYRGYELSNGFVEVLPMPTEVHQDILLFLVDALRAFVKPQRLGKAQVAGLRVRLWEQKIREPDVVFMFAENADRRENRYWHGADLAMEVVSDDDPNRDLQTKRAEYAAAGIREYWIVDPRDRSITVLSLPEGATVYREAGRYTEGQAAESVLLDGFRIKMADVFKAE